MAVKFLLLLYASFVLINITKPTLAFLNGNQLNPSFSRVSTRNNIKKFPVLCGVKGDIGIIRQRIKSAIIAAVSLQLIFTPGQANAISPSSTINVQVPSPDVRVQTADVKGNADEILNNPLLLAFSIPQSSGILTTTIRSEAILEGASDVSFKRLQWLKDVGPVDIDAMLESLPRDISHISEKIESLSASWILLFGLVSTVLVADASQHSKKLDQLTDEQANFIAEQTSERASIDAVNADTVEVLKAESLTLTEAVESLIKQLDEKSAHIDTLSETLEGLSQSIGNTDTNAKQVLAQLAKQLVVSESTIESLKTQLLEAPEKVAKNVEDDYKKQLSNSETIIAGMKQKMITIQEDSAGRLAIASRNIDDLQYQNTQMLADLLQTKEKADLLQANPQLGNNVGNDATLLKNSESTLQKALLLTNDMDLRMNEMLTRIEMLTEDNTRLASKLLEAEEMAVGQRKIMTEQLDKAAETLAMLPTAGDAQKLLSQVTAENDDLKQRLLSSDESLFELQQVSLRDLSVSTPVSQISG